MLTLRTEEECHACPDKPMACNSESPGLTVEGGNLSSGATDYMTIFTGVCPTCCRASPFPKDEKFTNEWPDAADHPPKEFEPKESASE